LGPFPVQRLRFSCTSTAQSRRRGLPEALNLNILPGFIGRFGYNHLAFSSAFSAQFHPCACEQYFTLLRVFKENKENPLASM
jgi:hypothetical protein